MIYLFVVITFFGSTGHEPFAAIASFTSAEACAAKAAEVSAQANADQKVEGYTAKCVTVPTKS